MEYLRAFQRAGLGVRAWGAHLDRGAFGVFRRDLLVEAGGVGHDPWRGFRAGRPEFASACAIPAGTTDPVRGRARLLDGGSRKPCASVPAATALAPRPVGDAVGLPRDAGGSLERRIGLVALPWYWLSELAAPVLELTGLGLMTLGAALGVVSMVSFGLFIAVAYGYAGRGHAAAMVIEELPCGEDRRWRASRRGVAGLRSGREPRYRQATAVWRTAGWWSALRGQAAVWGTMTREDHRHGRPGWVAEPLRQQLWLLVGLPSSVTLAVTW